MTISELMSHLESLKEKWGDLEVEVRNPPCTYSKPWLTVNKLTNNKNIVAIN